jgi:hypothetical protein
VRDLRDLARRIVDVPLVDAPSLGTLQERVRRYRRARRMTVLVPGAAALAAVVGVAPLLGGESRQSVRAVGLSEPSSPSGDGPTRDGGAPPGSGDTGGAAPVPLPGGADCSPDDRSCSWAHGECSAETWSCSYRGRQYPGDGDDRDGGDGGDGHHGHPPTSAPRPQPQPTTTTTAPPGTTTTTRPPGGDDDHARFGEGCTAATPNSSHPDGPYPTVCSYVAGDDGGYEANAFGDGAWEVRVERGGTLYVYGSAKGSPRCGENGTIRPGDRVTARVLDDGSGRQADVSVGEMYRCWYGVPPWGPPPPD